MSRKTLAGLAGEALALSDAATDGDMDEARFRAHVLASGLGTASYALASIAAARVIVILGSPGCDPAPGLGQALVELIDQLLGHEAIEA